MGGGTWLDRREAMLIMDTQATAAVLEGVDGAMEVAREELAGLRLLKESTADALLTGRLRVATEG